MTVEEGPIAPPTNAADTIAIEAWHAPTIAVVVVTPQPGHRD